MNAVTLESRYDTHLRNFMMNMFNHVAGGIAVSGIVAWAVSMMPSVLYAIHGTAFKWVVMFAPLAFIFWFSMNMKNMSLSTIKAGYYAFTAFMGLALSYIFVAYTGESITSVFLVTTCTYLASSLYGYTTKRDLTGMGSFLFMGLIGIIIASIVNIFLQNSEFQFIISIIGVLVFTGLTAWDVQNAKNIFNDAPNMVEGERYGVMAAFGLYLNFINLFQMLLHLLGNRE